LSALLGSGARAEVLRLFLTDPMRDYYQRQIEAATGLPIRAVQRELERLAKIRLLYRRNEGNRTYYQVDIQFPLFHDLRNLFLRAGTPLDRIRGEAAVDASIILLIHSERENRILLVYTGKRAPEIGTMELVPIDALARDEFVLGLAGEDPRIDEFLRTGVDLLGRREDVIWRRIEAAGYVVPKAKGVA
jgi:DNA-binding transcriptional ArsR family regulator